MRRLKNLAITVLIVLALIVIFQNTDTVEARFLLAKVSVPLVLMLLVTFLLGLGAGYLAASLRTRAGPRTPGAL